MHALFLSARRHRRTCYQRGGSRPFPNVFVIGPVDLYSQVIRKIGCFPQLYGNLIKIWVSIYLSITLLMYVLHTKCIINYQKSHLFKIEPVFRLTRLIADAGKWISIYLKDLNNSHQYEETSSKKVQKYSHFYSDGKTAAKLQPKKVLKSMFDVCLINLNKTSFLTDPTQHEPDKTKDKAPNAICIRDYVTI